MKKLLTTIILLIFISCTTEDLEKEVIPEEIVTEEDQEIIEEKEDEEEIIEEKDIVSPSLSWKKITYKTYKKQPYSTELLAFENEGIISQIKENLGIKKYLGGNYNFIKETLISGQTMTTNYYYTKDTLNNTVKIEVDTITYPKYISHDELNNRKQNLDNNIIFEFLEEKDSEFKYLRHITKKTNIFLNQTEKKEIYYYDISSTNVYIYKEGNTKQLTVEAGTFYANEYSIIGRNKENNERVGSGISTVFYHDDFIIQELNSITPFLSYTNKKELSDIEYLTK